MENINNHENHENNDIIVFGGVMYIDVKYYCAKCNNIFEKSILISSLSNASINGDCSFLKTMIEKEHEHENK